MSKMGQLLREELLQMCSDRAQSFLQGKPHSKLASFTWHAVLDDIEQHAPTLLQLLKTCARKTNELDKTNAVIGLCTALLCKHHQPTMSLVQKLISLILYTGHCSKKVPIYVHIVLIPAMYLTTIFAPCRFSFDYRNSI